MADNAAQPDTVQWNGIQADGNARQHNGNAYNNNTTHNYASPTPPINVPVKPPEDPIHGDLMRACRQGQGPQRLNFLLGKGADIDHRDEKQRTPLHHAASSGSLATVEHLVDNGADIHACADRVGTPLHAAALSGSKEVVERLVRAGCKIDASDKWIGTPLHCAALCGSTDAVRYLLEGGADKDKFSEWVGTPLSIAAAKVDVGVVEALLEHGADVNAECGYFGSAAHMAFAAGNVELIRRLNLAGADFSRMSSTCYKVYHTMLESLQSSFANLLGSRALEGETIMFGFPVILAIYYGNLEAVTFCMSLANNGHCRHSYKSYTETWYTSEVWRDPSSWHYSSVHLAIANLDIDMLRLLLDSGVSDSIDPTTSLVSKSHRAALNAKNASACISLLIERGYDISSLRTSGETLLMTIMGCDEDEVTYETAKAVLEHGAPVNAVDSDGKTALMIVAGTNHKSRFQCVELLCDFGARVNVVDKNGRTALRYAEKWGGQEGYRDIKRILQSCGRHEIQPPTASWINR